MGNCCLRPKEIDHNNLLTEKTKETKNITNEKEITPYNIIGIK